MANWKLTDAWEMGYEYECSNCGVHVDVRSKDKGLPPECPRCGAPMMEGVDQCST